MKPIMQLLRQPIRTVAILILLTVSASFMCLGWGVMQSAKVTTDELNNSFVTLAIYNESVSTIWEDTELSDGTKVRSVRTLTFDGDVKSKVTESPAFRKEYNHQHISAYCPSLRTLTSAATDNRYYSSKDRPYNRAVLVFELTEIIDHGLQTTIGFDSDGNMIPVAGSYDVNLIGEVIEYAALHPDYEPQEKVDLWCRFDSQEEFEAFKIDIGKNYIVNMDEYVDSDLHLKAQIASSFSRLSLTVDDIDWSNISYDLRGYDPQTIKDTEMVAQYWDEELGFGKSLRQLELDSIGFCTDYNIKPSSEDSVSIEEINCSLEDFLANPENGEWVQLIDDMNKQYSCVPVFGTDMLESFYLFHQNIAYVSEGRSLESADYSEGKKVCLISETLADMSGLKVGDKIDLSFYLHPPYHYKDYTVTNPQDFLYNEPNKSNAEAYPYQSPVDFEEESVEYEIVGLYRHTDQWGSTGASATYNFTPNTVFVPRAALKGYDTYTRDSGLYYSLTVKNGRYDEIKQILAENEYPSDFFVYLDGGYSSIESTVNSLNESAKELFMAAAATWLAVLAAYIALFVIRQRRNAGLMLSLGAGRTRTMKFVLVTAMIPAVVSAVIGAAVGGLLLSRTVNSVLNDAAEATGLAFSSTASMSAAELQSRVQIPMSSMVIACGALIAVYLAVLAIVARAISRKKPLTLIRK